MRTTITFLLLLLGLHTTALGSALRRSAPEATSTPTPIAQISPAPSPAQSASPAPSSVKVQFIPVEYYSTAKEREMIVKAGKKMNEVVQSQCFKDFMSKRKLIQTDGRSADQVAAHLQSLTGKINVVMYERCMSFSVFHCPKPTSAVAYREPPSDDINLNRAYFDINDSEMGVCDWAGTIGHESLGHSLGGYDHDYSWNAKRDFSVPYSIAGANETNKDAFQVCCHE